MRQELDKSEKDPNYKIEDKRLFLLRNPAPSWVEYERREAEEKKNEEERRVRFNTEDNNRNPNDDSRNNDNIKYDTRAIRDSRRVTYSA